MIPDNKIRISITINRDNLEKLEHVCEGFGVTKSNFLESYIVSMFNAIKKVDNIKHENG